MTMRALTAITAAVLICAGCATPTKAPATDSSAPPAPLTVSVTIRSGVVTPSNATLQTRVGEPIVIRVDSDVTDELHVHSTPDHSFEIEPKSGQTFQFSVSVPGKVDVELHKLKKTIATISVQP
ncbi:hypothetical protein CCUG60885_04092 [Mycobacteroides salmoniphilum]|uniref:EfeO-type cupredoxin-like domain-containing protein n=2 Tax=Mycobacteroides salmoniphilum TaxID=404941 RepID=A0A4R8SBN5_9MYCO|nr:hypothetical protein [Mycobacteroides salmoniphilum]TDZ91979.1 hypothetical protein CCUG60885_04092 [Mycobacteroides salmoniphilum]TEA07210.1 hypothetical protein CCUG60883_01242 [Mycobacteroides salmoniphilum]